MDMSSSASDIDGGSVGGEGRVVRILALHGKGGSGPEFRGRLVPLCEALAERVASLGYDGGVRFDCPTAPFALGDGGDGNAWWTLPPGVRSFDASEYIGFELSASVVRDSMECLSGSTSESGGYDFVLGHSQGAILLAALLANGEVPPPLPRRSGASGATAAAPRGYIFNGAAWPNPFTRQMESFRWNAGGFDAKKSTGGKEGHLPSSSLFVIGEADYINPPEGARRVRDALVRAGMDVNTCDHPGGHSVPCGDGEAVGRIADWMTDVLLVGGGGEGGGRTQIR